MADFSVTATGVVARAGATTTAGTAGATITAGQSVYLDANDTKWKLAQCDGTGAEAGLGGIGVALHASVDTQPLKVITAGDWYAGAAAEVGEDYYVSDTAGGLIGRADLELLSAKYRTLICTGITGGDMRMIGSYTGSLTP